MRPLMVLGTASGVGKSALCAALCRLFARRKISVAPFKAQNVSLNSFVTEEGGEIARSQALQARAAGAAPHADMNPMLIKPEAGGRSHIILGGRYALTTSPADRPLDAELLGAPIRAAFERLSARFDLIIMEGMGGAAEINLFDRDIANFRAAEMADAEVLLAGNIERGGVFAALYGTWALCPPEWQQRIRGFVINQLRGAPENLGDGPRELSRRTGVPVLGVLPHVEDLRLEAEDGLELDAFPRTFSGGGQDALHLAVLRLPHISNFTDFEPFLDAAGVAIAITDDARALDAADAVFLPGSKSVAADLAWLRRKGLDRTLEHLRGRGAPAVGICGGYQMLGEAIHDPGGVESPDPFTAGLGWLPVETTLAQEKTLRRTRAVSQLPFWGGGIEGYEIRNGRTSSLSPSAPPAFRPDGAGKDPSSSDGAFLAGENIWGTNLHGLFENDAFRAAFLEWAAEQTGQGGRRQNPSPHNFRRRQIEHLDRWSGVVETRLDLSPFSCGKLLK